MVGSAVDGLVYVGGGRVEWQDTPAPTPGDREVVVRPLAVARCDLDAPAVRSDLFPGPYTVGHETVADVVACGPRVGRWAVGDRVLVPFQISCGHCVACRDGRFGGCRTYRAPAGAVFGFGASGGGFGGAVADLLAVPEADHLLLRAPDGVSPATLCTLPDNAVDAYRAVGPPLLEHPGGDVLIVGGGAPSIGLYAVTLAWALGAASVRYVDRDARQCEVARSLGAEVIHQVGEWPRRFDRAVVTLENTGEIDGLAATLRSTDAYGTCTSVAIYFGETTPVPLLEMYTRGITFHTSRADSMRHLPAVCDLVEREVFRPAPLSTVVPWHEAADAWLEPAVKLVVARED